MANGRQQTAASSRCRSLSCKRFVAATFVVIALLLLLLQLNITWTLLPKHLKANITFLLTEQSNAAATTMRAAGDIPIVFVGFEHYNSWIGNYMFQYASGLALAARYGCRAVLALPGSAMSSLDDMRRTFRLSGLPVLPARPPPWAAVDLRESGWSRYDAVRFDSASTFKRSVYMRGYFQSWKYFAPVADRVRREFALTDYAKRAVDSYFRSAGLQWSEESGGGGREAWPLLVGVHVRRGDMLQASAVYTVAPAEYLLKAIAHYRDKFAAPRYNVSFVFATDDHEWVRDLVASRLPPDLTVRYVRMDAWGDMAVLSSCNHSIITGGSLGWWAAWLAGGDVVYYSDFIRRDSPLYTYHNPADHYPPSWLGLTA